MTELYDVLIVGAGPGGAMAAKVAGENGLKAALIERKKDIRSHPQNLHHDHQHR